jgi:hypothetical protein
VIGKTSHARRRRLLRYLGGMGWQHIGDARNGKGTNPDLSCLPSTQMLVYEG